MKRAFDLALSLLGLPIAVPVIAVCALVIRLTSQGSPILVQRRVGRGEAEFDCLKLRTMYAGTATVPSHETPASFVTPVGRFLRRFKLDELPQLWNIVRGDMSFVGPRPCLPSQAELVQERRKFGLQHLRPGITGVSQIAGVDMSKPAKLAELDATYLDDMSLGRDLKIIFATLVGSGRGDRVAR